MAINVRWPAMEQLKAAHQAGQCHLDRLAQALDSPKGWAAVSAETVEGVLSFFQTELAEHFLHEEQALFPVLARVIGRAGPIEVMLNEHQALRQSLDTFKALWAKQKGVERKDEELSRLVAHIVWFLRSHIQKEDGVLFPMAEEVLQPALKVEVTERVKEIKP